MKALLTITMLLCAACSKSGDSSQSATTGLMPPTAPTECPVAPAPAGPHVATVIIKNALVGQIRQIAMGVDHWTWIQSEDLKMDCVAEDETHVTCVRYPYEPYPYTTVAP